VTEFKTGSVGHTVSAGLEFMNEKQNSFGRDGLGVVNPQLTPTQQANLYAPNANDPVTGLAPVKFGAYTRGATTTAAVYAFDTVKLNEQFQLNGGLRVEHFNTDTNAVTGTRVALVNQPYLEDSDTLVSWKAGALYKPAENGSIYAAFANSKTPPGSANFSLSATPGAIAGPSMAPQETRNIEIGTKWDVLAKTLALTAAAYRTENLNEISQLDVATNTYAQLGKRRVQGIELGMVGQFTKNWQVTAGLATMKTSIVEGTNGNNATGAASRWSPDLTATIWTSYKVDDKLTVGGGVRYVSEQKRLVDPAANPALNNVAAIPAYTVADAVVAYKVSNSVTLQLNVYNLFDKFYINALNNGGSRFTLGLERSAQLTANVAF
jgi:catecholate siderophore receptor